MTLRQYQQSAVDSVYGHLRSHDDNPCVVIPPGGGKSHVIAQIIYDSVTKWDGRILMVTHQRELIEQNVSKLEPLLDGIEVGVYCAGLDRRDTDNKVIAASIQSIANKADELGHFDLVLVDECHLIPPEGEGRYLKFLDACKSINPNLRIIGFTATPYRLSGGAICKPENMLNQICYEISIKELIAMKYLSPLSTKKGSVDFDVSKLHVRAGEFVASEMESVFSDEEKVVLACNEIILMTDDRNTCLIFACSIEHGRMMHDYIRSLGHDAYEIYGSTNKSERDEILEAFKRGEFKYLINMGVLTTGVDVPGIDCIPILRATMSPGLLVQMIGRGTRLAEGKDDCLILDYGENIIRHGPIDKIKIKEARPRGDKTEAPLVIECKNCHELVGISYEICPKCGEKLRDKSDLKHATSASEADLFSGEKKLTKVRVRDVYYSKNVKEKPEGNSVTLRVEYFCGIGQMGTISEFVCFEHQGYARGKAESWWRLRMGEDVPIPNTVDEAIEMSDAIPKPTELLVDESDKWPQIVEIIIDGAEESDLSKEYDVEQVKTPKLTGEKIEYVVDSSVENWQAAVDQKNATSGDAAKVKDFRHEDFKFEDDDIPF